MDNSIYDEFYDQIDLVLENSMFGFVPTTMPPVQWL